jgi:dephospho-CoA kinase
MIIGLSGVLSAGKDTVAEYLENKKGFVHISLSNILREIVSSRGMEINLQNLTKVGNSLIEEFGQGYLVKEALKRVDPQDDVVISSIRQPGEIEELRKHKNFKMIFVDAKAEIRFERLKKRGRFGDSETFEEFMAIENKQLDGKSGAMDLGKCKQMSDIIIENNGTREEFESAIEKVISSI